ncbi:MAG: hypothetical protein RLZZ258_802 [Actinomycetota bacterium]|jgi:hypothetical protein|uniref:DUF3043 domain-containing protein n=1 Tax=Rhodoluna sp. TaxID=1969481 RepID=UPI0025D1AC9F|nr:DUF3043 domain-containing protein [Rhodoluna sp.]
MTEQEKTTAKASSKGRPTPSRKQQEAANVKPLVGAKSKEAKQAAKAALIAERRKAREGMANGDERYMLARDRGPQRKFVRDYVDARFTIGELLMPALFVVILLSAIDDKAVQVALLGVMWTLFLGVFINAYFLGRGATKALAAKYGESKVEKGLRWYAGMRSVQMRALRLPKPQVKRGNKL